MKNIEILAGILTPAQLVKLDKASSRHLEQSNITFELHSLSGQVIEIETQQGETSAGKYATEETLVKRTTALFAKILPDYDILVRARAYHIAPASTVDAAWIDNKMQQRGIRIKQIAHETGIDRESISDWVTGKRSMSQLVKAMFYFYLSK